MITLAALRRVRTGLLGRRSHTADALAGGSQIVVPTEVFKPYGISLDEFKEQVETELRTSLWNRATERIVAETGCAWRDADRMISRVGALIHQMHQAGELTRYLNVYWEYNPEHMLIPKVFGPGRHTYPGSAADLVERLFLDPGHGETGIQYYEEEDILPHRYLRILLKKTA